MSLAGTHIGRISLEALIGCGGMGEVYRGFDEVLERRVAVKAIRAEHRFSPESRARFLREARLLSRLDHPGICRLYDLIEAEDADYLVLEFVEGRTLCAVPSSELSHDTRLGIGEAIAHALAAAHSEKIVHRDLKPENVMITTKGEVKVLDFGVARSLTSRARLAPTQPAPAPQLAGAPLEPSGQAVTAVYTSDSGTKQTLDLGTFQTEAGSLAGTLGFMSPEQARGEEINEASDMYSLGILLHELFTGTQAYQASSPNDLYVKVTRAETSAVTGLDPDLVALIESLEQLEPDTRPSAEETAHRLRWIREKPARTRRKRVQSAVAAALVATVAVTSGGVALWSWYQTRQKVALAQRLGQQVRGIEAIMRFAALSPRHDIRPEKALVRSTMAVIEEQARRVGRAGNAPAAFALGSANLALGENSLAREQLDRAWAGDLRGPEVAYARGLALSEVYRYELWRTRFISDPRARDARRAQLRHELRDPALVALRMAGRDPAVPSTYVEGLVAFLEERHEDALGKATGAAGALPWFYEAHRLEAQIHVAIGNAKRESGDTAQAIASYERAVSALDKAIVIGESDVQSHELLCYVWAQRAVLDTWYQTGAAVDSRKKAEDACQSALGIDPGRPEAHTYLSTALLFGVVDQTAAKPVFERALVAATRATELNPNDYWAWHNIGVAEMKLATLAIDEAERAETGFGRAITAFERSIALQPSYGSAFNNLGLTRRERAELRIRHDRDPLEDFAGSTEAFRRAAVADNRYAFAYRANLAGVRMVEAEWSIVHKREATEAVDEADHAIREAQAINPKLPGFHATLANIDALRGRIALAAGADPTAMTERALASAKAGIEAQPDSSYARIGAAESLLARAEWRISNRLRADADLDRAFALLKQCRSLNPGDPDASLVLARTHVLRARAARARGASPTTHIQAATETLRAVKAPGLAGPAAIAAVRAEIAALRD
jgi:serine/threonine protein kinase/tetratricopeptide (TPR) repeat protein